MSCLSFELFYVLHSFIFVHPYQCIVTKLLKVLIILPKCKVLAFSLESSDLVEYAKVSSVIVRAELVTYFSKQIKLSCI